MNYTDTATRGVCLRNDSSRAARLDERCSGHYAGKVPPCHHGVVHMDQCRRAKTETSVAVSHGVVHTDQCRRVTTESYTGTRAIVPPRNQIEGLF